MDSKKVFVLLIQNITLYTQKKNVDFCFAFLFSNLFCFSFQKYKDFQVLSTMTTMKAAKKKIKPDNTEQIEEKIPVTLEFSNELFECRPQTK